MESVTSDLLDVVFENHLNSESYANMVQSDIYFNGKNTVISDKKKMMALVNEFEDSKGNIHENTYLKPDLSKANNKVRHNYLYELIMQCTNYAVGKPIKLDYKQAITKANVSEEDSQVYRNIVEDILYKDNNFLSFLQTNVVNVQLYGVSYFRWVLDNGMLRLVVLNPKEIVMFKDDYDSPVICFRFFTREEFSTKDKQFILIQCAEVFDESKKILWEKDSKGKWQIKGEETLLYAEKHVFGSKVADVKAIPINTFPIIEWKFDSKATQTLSLIKDFVDIIDNDLSELVNNVDDIQEVIWILSNYQGQSVSEFMSDMKEKKAIKVGDGGSATAHTVDIPTDARKVIYELSERNIYRFGFGVNFMDRTNLGNVTGVGLKWSYAPLEQKSNSIEATAQNALNDMFNILFSILDIPYDSNDLEFIFDRTMITNEIEKTQMVMSASSLISVETALDNLPLVQDTEEELKRLELENEYDPVITEPEEDEVEEVTEVIEPREEDEKGTEQTK